jgi:hypothetical protein
MTRKLSWIFLIGLFTFTALLPSCTRVGSSINGSGNIIDQDLKVTDFNSVNVQGPFSLEILQDKSFKVTLSTDENLIKRVQVSLERKLLKVRIEAPATFFPTSLMIKITMPAISSLNLSAGVKANISGFNYMSNFTLFLSDGSVLNGDLGTINADFNLSKASKVDLTGSAVMLDLDCLSGSKFGSADFVITRADVNLKGSSEATLNVNGRLDIVLSEMSKVYYLGNPLISDASITGGSTMVHK